MKTWEIVNDPRYWEGPYGDGNDHGYGRLDGDGVGEGRVHVIGYGRGGGRSNAFDRELVLREVKT